MGRAGGRRRWCRRPGTGSGGREPAGAGQGIWCEAVVGQSKCNAGGQTGALGGMDAVCGRGGQRWGAGDSRVVIGGRARGGRAPLSYAIGCRLGGSPAGVRLCARAPVRVRHWGRRRACGSSCWGHQRCGRSGEPGARLSWCPCRRPAACRRCRGGCRGRPGGRRGPLWPPRLRRPAAAPRCRRCPVSAAPARPSSPRP